MIYKIVSKPHSTSFWLEVGDVETDVNGTAIKVISIIKIVGNIGTIEGVTAYVTGVDLSEIKEG
ncbi:2-octaprenyl-6-methoxyphenol hydroxylase [Oceanobacillus picturae]|uniref:2-octaprenyl-6-methoxyphenol hydroxylase n=1 Tax=Oceanobacillus picturae TaxID=171693 RepID=A0A0U9HCS1_9BACI|nr:hypothetical protein [Oceanobacillus picturae]GAQ18008.1 2-octaprenyl-6-methoxyphenol hydroxylase [Oceanobacillus picturae]